MEITKTTDQDTTTWTATIDDTPVSTLSIWTANREICFVETANGHERRGYARALWDAANTDGDIYHTIASHRSADGDAFVAAVGGWEIDEADALVIDSCCCEHCDH